VGRTEDRLTEGRGPFEAGVSASGSSARGQITGDSHGMLKLLSREDRTLLGVHRSVPGGTRAGSVSTRRTSSV
jgi:NAD(P) transhydrogenase